MTLILGFDTSGPHCAATLLSEGKVIAQQTEEMGRGQAERLMPLLEEVIEIAGVGWSDLAALGVGVGPGNFTGIRISVSAARGLSLGLGIPAIGVSGFEVLSFEQPHPCVALIAAPRNQVYVQRVGGDGLHPPSFCAFEDVTGPVGATWVGAQSRECAERFQGHTSEPNYPIAEAIARIAMTRLDRPAQRPAPLYIKAADAAPPRDPAPVILS